MARAYSIFEAKTHLSEILRIVKTGKEVTVCERGNPVARIIPFRPHTKQTLPEKLAQLENAGLLVRHKGNLASIQTEKRAGALKRFLKERE